MGEDVVWSDVWKPSEKPAAAGVWRTVARYRGCKVCTRARRLLRCEVEVEIVRGAESR
jgi:hypothetical protein